jgi:hypothetical protein
MTRDDAAYAAGIFDAEGCVKTIVQKTKSGTIQLHVCLAIANTDAKVIKWLKDISGFGFYTVPKSAGAKNHAPCWQFRVEDTLEALSFFVEIFSFSVVKRDQISNAIKFLWSRMIREYRSSYNEFEIDVLYNIREEIRTKRNSKASFLGESITKDSLIKVVKESESGKYHVFAWSVGAIAKLGTRPDAEIAKELGTTWSNVQSKRSSLGISPFRVTRRNSGL